MGGATATDAAVASVESVGLIARNNATRTDRTRVNEDVSRPSTTHAFE